MISKRRSFIIGIKGKKLTKPEIIFLRKYKPWGIILFSRNIDNLDQIKQLVQQIKRLFKDKKYPILIDEEGGRISRLKKIIDNSLFSASYFGNLYNRDINKFKTYYNVYINQISYLLNEIGININSVPCLDLSKSNKKYIIGDRAFSNNPVIVSKIGDICIDLFHKKGIGTIIKHIPGHGMTKIDSHFKTPIVNNKFSKLIKKDFKAFKNKKSIMAMTSHIIYKDLDKINTATHSKIVIKMIRDKIKFKNIIITDDISMKALKTNLKNSVIKSFTAGCNLVLHCNGSMREMNIVAKNSPLLSNFIIKKTSQLYKILS